MSFSYSQSNRNWEYLLVPVNYKKNHLKHIFLSVCKFVDVTVVFTLTSIWMFFVKNQLTHFIYTEKIFLNRIWLKILIYVFSLFNLWNPLIESRKEKTLAQVITFSFLSLTKIFRERLSKSSKIVYEILLKDYFCVKIWKLCNTYPNSCWF